MPSHSTHYAPSKQASIQAFVSRAGFFWRGGAVSFVVVFAASILVALSVGDVYESESIVEFADDGSAQDRPEQAHVEDTAKSPSGETPDEQLRRALLDPASLEQLTRELEGEIADGGALQAANERTRRSIHIRSRAERRFAIAFRAATAVGAQRGSDWLAQFAMRSLDARGEPAAQETLKRIKTLEERTIELAAFVAEHPEVALNPPGPAPSASAVGASSARPVDTALVVLQQQRARLESRIADAERKEAAGANNPYDNSSDRAALHRMLAQVRAAIAARQAVSLRAGAEASSGSAPRASSQAAKTAGSAPLQAEWQRLVDAVVQAQLQVPAKRDGAAQGGGVRIVQRASLPSRPLKPDKRLICLIGMAGGVWTGILWAFARAALGHDAGDAYEIGEEDGSMDGEELADPDAQPGWTDAHGFDETMLPDPDGSPPTPPPTTAKDGAGWQLLGGAAFSGDAGGIQKPPGAGPTRIPKQLLATAPGVVDVSRVFAHTGSVPIRGQADSSPIRIVPRVELGRAREPGSVLSASQTGSAPIRTAGITQTFTSPLPGTAGWQSPPLVAASPGRQSPPPMAAGATVVEAHPEPPQAPKYGLALRTKPPEDVFSLRDVPLGWSPHPSMLQTGSMTELLTLRDQLYRLAVNGCFVVGVTSSSDGVADKSCVAAQLASLLAGPGKARVLLMESDFDHPSVHRLMRIDMPFSQGFSEQMRKRMSPANRAPWVLFRCAPNLHVLAEGLVRSPGLLSSVQFGEALAELRGYYDVIVSDGPIAATSVDTCAFDALMDGIVLVGPVGSSPSKLLEEASKWFAQKQLMAVISADASAERRIDFGSKRA